MTPHDFLDARMALASRFAFRETSGYRSAQSNRDVGGVPGSAHQFWLGVDVVLDPETDTPAFVKAARQLGLFVLVEIDHVHLQPATWAKG